MRQGRSLGMHCVGADAHRATAAHRDAFWPPSLCVPQLSKEVRALRTHEAALLDAYHAYLKGLLKVRPPSASCGRLHTLSGAALCSTSSTTHQLSLTSSAACVAWPCLQAFKGSTDGQGPLQQGRIAVKCMAGLLEAAPHFNYRSGTHTVCGGSSV